MNLFQSQKAWMMGLAITAGCGIPVQTMAADSTHEVAEVQQSKVVKGHVVDSEGPLIGATVLVKGTKNSAVTDTNGNFTVTAKPGATIIISYVGYNTLEVSADANLSRLVMVEDTNTMDEVVVIGYGVQKKSDLTGAVASVKADDIKGLATTDAAAALQGKVSGVQIINSGAPGTGAEIRVRGFSSNSGNIGPLLIVDGLKVDNIQYLDPSLIESMEILKDASSAAIYGAQAGNGVVLITTKTGKSQGGKSSVSYEFKASRQSLGKKAELFDAPGFIEYHTYRGDLKEGDLEKVYNYDGTNTDWYDAVFEDSWALQHNITVQGGNDKGHLLTALNLVDNNGIVKGSQDVYKRITGQINADYKFFDWLSVSTNNSLEKWKTKGVTNGYGSVLNGVVAMDPLTPVTIPADAPESAFGLGQYAAVKEGKYVPVDADGNYYGSSKLLAHSAGNPLWQINRRDQARSGLTLRGNIAANLTPLSGLVITSRLGYRLSQSNYHNYQKPFYINSMANDTKYTINAENNTGLYYQWENFANYNKTIGKHNIGAMIGMSFTKNHTDNLIASAEDTNPILSGDASNFQYMSYVLSSVTKSVTNSPNDATELSYFGRLSYSYDDRYFFQFNIRRDAFDSSKLKKDNRWGNFPSVSAGWTISNEKFFKDAVSQDLVSFLKLRASWGRNGNINILNNYPYTAPISLNSNWYQMDGNSGDVTLGSKPTGLANPELTWETSEQIDFGLDARFLNNRLSLGIDYYNKNTKDLLIKIAPLPEIGVSSSYANSGKVNNYGFDFELGWRDKVGDLRYSVTANFGTLHNEVKEVASVADRISPDEPALNGFNNRLSPLFEKGYPIWYMYGWKYAGVEKETGKALYYTKDGEITNAPTDDDKQYVGSAIPTFTYGITINLEYKGFDFTVFGTGVAGNDIYNVMVGGENWQVNSLTTFWENSTKSDANGKIISLGKYPDMKLVGSDWTFFSSSAAVFNGSYFKFKQIQLGYTLPASITKKALINNARVYVSLDDYFTITSYPGADPETASMGSGFNRGFDNGQYPTSKKLTFGVNLTF
jgi:TonB-linked SusC/RagA family outer membrane protein